MSDDKVKIEVFGISINKSTIRRMETRLRRSTRVRAKEESSNKEKYIQHMKTLHEVAGDLLPMADTLSECELKKVIGRYENVIGDLLGIK
jgi:hypothetical protein|tara:strand:+ start:642 stop:911 length:270 start_codon:yes stop_codon:yes gene_type:complete